MTMSVHDFAFGQVAQPRKRLTVARPFRGEGLYRFGTDFLKDVFDFDFFPQRFAESPSCILECPVLQLMWLAVMVSFLPTQKN